VNVGSVQGFHGDNKVTDTDPSHYFGADPAIDIEKLTNDEDADTATGPLVPVGSTVTWKYVVKNTGNVRLTDVKVADDKLGLVSCGEWDGTLAAGQTVTCTQTGVATAGQYVNVGSVQGFYGDNKVSDTDPSHYFGFDPRIDVEKLTNGEDADTPTGPVVEVGSTVTWTYVVTNTGNVALTGVTITDDKLGPVGCGEWDGTLAVGQVVTCTATGTATAGQYSNLGTATGAYGGVVVTDSDPSHYFGEEAGGCTRTQGYWSTHWTDNGKQYDPTWALYHDNGTRKFFEEAPNLDNVNTGLNYIEILRRSAAGGNAYIILAQQFIAAELNKLAGAAVPSEVTATLANAAAMLADNKYEDVRDIPKSKTNDDRARALAWATILDQYNSGLIGPGHCE
jgi:hypothetical protein